LPFLFAIIKFIIKFAEDKEELLVSLPRPEALKRQAAQIRPGKRTVFKPILLGDEMHEKNSSPAILSSDSDDDEEIVPIPRSKLKKRKNDENTQQELKTANKISLKKKKIVSIQNM
jgi:hypothetical protein